MTVIELIRLLQECDPNKEVVIYDYSNSDRSSVDSVEEDDNDVKLDLIKMKAIGIKMVDIVPMSVSMALEHGYRVGNANPNDMGYEITYPNGYKS